jgi:hypothetical protein
MKDQSRTLAALALLGATLGIPPLTSRVSARSGGSRAAGPTQFLLVDHTTTFRDNWRRKMANWIEEPTDGFLMLFKGDDFAERRSKEIPGDWTQPVDYRDGTLHVRVEVLKKPNVTVTSGMIMRLISEKHSGLNTIWYCDQQCKFTRPGVYHFEEKIADGRRHYGPGFRFDRPLFEIQLIVTDDARGIVHKQWERGFKGEPDLGPYLPLEVRFSAYVVRPGARFAQPAWW